MKIEERFDKPVIRTPLNYYETVGLVTDYEHPDDISMTVPDQAMSPAEMLRRHASGLSLTGKVPMYSEIEVPDLATMDLVEIQAYREQLAKEIEESEKAFKDASKKLAEKQEAERIEKEVQKRLKDGKNEVPSKKADNSDTTSSNQVI